MNVLYSGDANIVDGVIISSISLAKNVSESLNIYILTASFEHNGQKREAVCEQFALFLEKYLRNYNREISVTLIDISEKFQSELPKANMDTRFTPGCMLRLYADDVEGLPSRVLYLDNDVLCRMNPGDFYNQKMGDNDIAGVLDYYGGWFFRQKFYKRDYLNSGILLLNMESIRKSGLFSAARQMCMTKKMFMPDQSALNKLCKNKIICNRKYNEQRKLHEDTVFQHFTTSFRFFPYFHSVNVKPWNVEGMHKILKLHEYDDLLEEYINTKNLYLKEKNNEQQSQ